jgi:hypothetical protein
MRGIKQIVCGLSALSLIAACSSPTNFTKNSYSVTPNPLEAKGDMVSVSITATVPPKSINSKVVVKFSPYLKTSTGAEIPLKEMTVKGMKAKANADATVDTKLGGTVSYTDNFAYKADMKHASLMPRFTVNGVAVPFEAKPLAEGTIATAYLIKTDYNVIVNSDDYKAVENNKSVSIYFPMDVDKFNPNYKVNKATSNKKQIADLKTLLKTDKNFVARGIAINAFASPDGELSRNSNLSKGREESTYKFFKKELKKLGFTEVNDTTFSRGYSTSEDWAGFATMLEMSDLSDKTEILNIVNNKSISDEERESLIRRNHAASWEKATKSVLPQLRRSELVIKGASPTKTDEQLMTFYGNYSALSAIELFHLAVITADLAKKEEVLKAFTAANAEDWRGFNDLGAIQLKLNNLIDAESNMSKANALSADNAAVLANMGVLANAKGNVAEAEKMFKSASSKGTDVSYNLACIAIKKGNYSEAVSLFNKSGKADFNAALAKLLSGDATGAKNMIDAMNPDQLDASHYYLRAVCGARMNNQDVLTTNLARAVGMNGEIRKMAKDDVEFIKFFSNPLFEGAIR